MLSASIIIRTKNEARFIAETLRLVSDQTHKPQQIIVVDSGSTDDTVKIVRQWPGVTLIEIPAEQFTFGRALNIGIEAARGEIVVPLSAHAFPRDSRWLENLTRHFCDPKIAAVYGRQLPHVNAWPPAQTDFLGSFGDKPKIQKDPALAEDYFFSNANAAIRRELWRERPFDESLPRVEDQYWCREILRLGYAVVYDPEAAVYHSHNESLVQVYRRSLGEFQAYHVVFGRQLSLAGAWLQWRYFVRGDTNFVLVNGISRIWLCWIPVYRLVNVYGSLRPFLPRALWAPLTRRITRCMGLLHKRLAKINSTTGL